MERIMIGIIKNGNIEIYLVKIVKIQNFILNLLQWIEEDIGHMDV